MGLLGALSPAQFLAQHWQKKPLLVRQAMPGFQGLLSREQLARLASRDDVIARTVRERDGRRGARWQLEEGPFARLDLTRVPKARFTLLVAGLEAHVEGAWDLLARFSFIPWACIDDLMVSWAAPGGSVGPHYDLYDVFLLQGSGRRRWQISEGCDLACVSEEGVRVLRRFRPTDEWVLEPGDMLYLPPEVGHWGVAETECTTYSIGFAAPTHEQLVHNFLGFLAEDLAPEGQVDDVDLTPAAHPGALPDAMVTRVAEVLERLRWDDDVVRTFLGRLLTGPKPHSPRPRPPKAKDRGGFLERLLRPGALVVGDASRLLFYGERFFLDGEAFEAEGALAGVLRQLADQRRAPLPLGSLDDDARERLYRLYRTGQLRFAGVPP